MSGVESSSTGPGWLHTVGLPARLGHPELLIAESSTDAYRVLEAIARYVARTKRTISAGETMQLGDRIYTFGALAEDEWPLDAILMSIEVNRVLGVTDVDVLQVLRVPELERCDHHFAEAVHALLEERPPP